MKIDELISPDDASVGLKAPDKAWVIQELATQAAEKLQIAAEEIAQELRRREELGSTGLGNGIALPHARLAKLDKPFGIAVRLKKPIEFDAVDGKPVDLVVLVLMPGGAQADQLNALACVARVLREEEKLERLRQANDAAEFYRELVRR
jgi:nitrogen PTS system EIIA component